MFVKEPIGDTTAVGGMPSSAGCGGVVVVSGSMLSSSTSWAADVLAPHRVLMRMPGIHPLTRVATIPKMARMVETTKVATAMSCQCSATGDATR